jgi:hypothetical protein
MLDHQEKAKQGKEVWEEEKEPTIPSLWLPDAVCMVFHVP